MALISVVLMETESFDLLPPATLNLLSKPKYATSFMKIDRVNK